MRRAARPEPVSLTAGIALVAVGTLLLLDRLGTLDLTFGAMAPMVLGALGAILLASGLSRGRRER
ncbi:MAG TPA: DUF5668 domain-containing protein [Solirubrobacteraceae bacterium]|nr:DUF5668 domain-containing protein [Solirubrobacteraceae bacterium]